jgi:adhesin/invasin
MRDLRVVVTSGFLLLAVACGGSDGGTPPADVNTLTKNAGDGQTATVGAAVAVAPAVRIANQNQAPVANVAVTFSVASGGGQVTGGSATTNASGIATVGGWTMGTAAGANTLTASAAGVNGSPVTFTVTASAGAPKTITKQGGDNQTASPNEAVVVKPSVKVVDQFGNPVAGVTVTFTIASGSGTVSGGSATTDAAGIATVGNWTLGPSQGANTLTATIAGTGVTGNPATFSATGQFVALAPTSSVSISGDKTYSSVNIPAGVTVTIGTDARSR